MSKCVSWPCFWGSGGGGGCRAIRIAMYLFGGGCSWKAHIGKINGNRKKKFFTSYSVEFPLMRNIRDLLKLQVPLGCMLGKIEWGVTFPCSRLFPTVDLRYVFKRFKAEKMPSLSAFVAYESRTDLTIFPISLMNKLLFRDISCNFLVMGVITTVSLSLSSKILIYWCQCACY